MLLPAYLRMVASRMTSGLFLEEGLLCLYASTTRPFTKTVSSSPKGYKGSILTRSNLPIAFLIFEKAYRMANVRILKIIGRVFPDHYQKPYKIRKPSSSIRSVVDRGLTHL